MFSGFLVAAQRLNLPHAHVLRSQRAWIPSFLIHPSHHGKRKADLSIPSFSRNPLVGFRFSEPIWQNFQLRMIRIRGLLHNHKNSTYRCPVFWSQATTSMVLNLFDKRRILDELTMIHLVEEGNQLLLKETVSRLHLNLQILKRYMCLLLHLLSFLKAEGQ